MESDDSHGRASGMELAAAYLAAEELISSIPTDTESGRLRRAAIYNGAAFFLDYAISAWYKRIAIEDRLPVYNEEEPVWRQRLALLTKIPWVVPIYARTEGIRFQLSRSLQARRSPNYLMWETSPPPSEGDQPTLDTFRYGPPLDEWNCIGIAFNVHSLATDEPKADLTSDTSMRDVYGNARTSLMEMGAKHARNIPKAGIIFSPFVEICPGSMNRFSSEWAHMVQCALYHPSPLQRWTGLRVGSKITATIVLATWKNEKGAAAEVEGLFYQLSTMVSWVYLLGCLDLRSASIPTPFPVTPAEREVQELMKVVVRAQREHRPTRSRSLNRSVAVTSFIAWAIFEAMQSERKRVPSGVPGTQRGIHLMLSVPKFKASVLDRLKSIKAIASYNPGRIRMLQEMARTIAIVSSLSERKRILVKLRSELVARNHFFWDKRAPVRIFCEHEMERLSMLSTGGVNEEELIREYSSDSRNALAGMAGLPILAPTLVECKYCGADLGTNWLVTIGNEEDIENVQRVEGTYLDDDAGLILSKLLTSRSVETRLLPTDMLRVIKHIIQVPLGVENRKLSKTNPPDKGIKEQFLLLAAIITVIDVLSSNGAPIKVNRVALEAHISKEYIDMLQKLGILPVDAIGRMMKYWSATLVKHIANPEALIKNSVLELAGVKEDKFLALFYATAMAFPLRLPKPDTPLSEALPIKVPSRRQYLLDQLSTAPAVDSNERIFLLRLPPVIATKRDPHVRLPPKTSLVIRSASVGTVDTTITREQFEEAVMYICPEILLHPITTPHGFPDGDDESAALFAPSILLVPHRFDGGKTCKWCRIDKSYDFDDAYFNRYGGAVQKEWIAAIPSEKMTCKISEPYAPIKVVELTASIDKELHRRFSSKFGWYTGPDYRFARELAFIAVGIGYYKIGAALLRFCCPTEECWKIITTAWNLFMQWGLEQKDGLTERTLDRLRSVLATTPIEG